jgi:uncharacterized protein (TIGR03437 family)
LQGTAPYQTNLAATSVSILDGAGVTTLAPIVSVSPNQVLFLVPPTVAPGTAQITVTNPFLNTPQVANNVEIATVAPGVLTVNGSGLAAAEAVQATVAGVQTTQLAYTTDANGALVPKPIAIGTGTTNTYLLLFGSGIARAGTALTTATVNGLAATVVYAGPAGADSGLDQVNILLPAKLAGAGYVNVQLTAEAIVANPVQVTIQ